MSNNDDAYLIDFGKRIRERRLELGMTQEKLAHLAGYTSKVSISKIESGQRDISREKVATIANALKCSPVWLLLGKEDEDDSDIWEFSIAGSVRAGVDGSICCEETGDKVVVPRSNLPNRNKRDFFALKVVGNSMYPEVLDGDTVIVERADIVDNGEMAVVIYNSDNAAIKFVRYAPCSSMDLISANPTYAPIHIEGSKLDECKILGRVIDIMRKPKRMSMNI